MSVDPLAEKYPYNAVYAFQENKMGMGRELEGLELGGAQFNNYAADFGKAVTSFIDTIEATFSYSDEHDIIPNVVSIETSKTTTISSNFYNYAMSSQYPNRGSAKLFNSPSVEAKSQMKTTAKVSATTEGVTVTTSHTVSKDMKTGQKESESKVVVGTGENGAFVSKTKTDGANSKTKVGLQAEVAIPVSTTDKVKFAASISIGTKK